AERSQARAGGVEQVRVLVSGTGDHGPVGQDQFQLLNLCGEARRGAAGPVSAGLGGTRQRLHGDVSHVGQGCAVRGERFVEVTEPHSRFDGGASGGEVHGAHRGQGGGGEQGAVGGRDVGEGVP